MIVVSYTVIDRESGEHKTMLAEGVDEIAGRNIIADMVQKHKSGEWQYMGQDYVLTLRKGRKLIHRETSVS